MLRKKPLMSIMIPNFNHSMYLDECIQSALRQTYENIEIIVMDNSSTDDSIRVAGKYAGDGVRVCRNAFNILNTNYKVVASMAKGKYAMLLCADDYIDESFVEKAINIMENNSNIGYVHGERDFITDDGEFIELEPFFNCSFMASGLDIMPLYMVTTIAHPSQGIFRMETFHSIGGYDMEIDHMNADRMLWFYLSFEADYAYIREKMCRIRVGRQTETLITQFNFQHPILCHLTIKEMVDFAKANNLPKVYQREEEALLRLAKDFLNYAAGMLSIQELQCAGRYLAYAELVANKIIEDEMYIRLRHMQRGEESIDMDYLEQLSLRGLQKARNYNPPENYEVIGEEVQ